MGWWEKAYPWIGAALVAAAAGKFLPASVIPDDLKDVFSGLLNVSAIAVGFLATAKSILISMEGRRVIQQLRRSGFYNIAVGYMITAIRASFIVAVLALVGLVVRPKAHGLGAWFLLLCVGLSAFAGLASYRVIDVLTEVLRVPERRE